MRMIPFSSSLELGKKDSRKREIDLTVILWEPRAQMLTNRCSDIDQHSEYASAQSVSEEISLCISILDMLSASCGSSVS